MVTPCSNHHGVCIKRNANETLCDNILSYMYGHNWIPSWRISLIIDVPLTCSSPGRPKPRHHHEVAVAHDNSPYSRRRSGFPSSRNGMSHAVIVQYARLRSQAPLDHGHYFNPCDFHFPLTRHGGYQNKKQDRMFATTQVANTATSNNWTTVIACARVSCLQVPARS